MICLLLQARYILIIQEIPAFSIYLIVEIIFENSQFGFKVLSFPTREVVKFKTEKVPVCLAKDLKNTFFLSQIYSLSSYTPFLLLFSLSSLNGNISIKYQQVHCDKPMSGAGSPSCRPGSLQ